MEGEELLRSLDKQPVLRVLDVPYVHLTLGGGDDLYITEYGLPAAGNLLPDNYWTDQEWFRHHSRKLSGTSTLYRIQTKPVGGRCKDIVLKWNRMGQDVPGETRAEELATAEFNSPFEEFSLTLELRAARGEAPARVLTHRPLAIYVPSQRMDLDHLGRKQHKIEAKLDSHFEVELDMHRKYAVIYEWIKGIDAVEAYRRGVLSMEDMTALLARAKEDLRAKGYVVRDNKAQHLIVRTAGADGDGGEGPLLRDRRGQVLYATIDFELLERTPEHERQVRLAKRRTYLFKQAHRFEHRGQFPANLHPVRIFGVDYVYGHIESTHGALWVVGRDPELFDYFLPEKWRKTLRIKLSVASKIYQTTTKDGVRLVWRVSKVGEHPDMDPFKQDEQRILSHGYNSPFEEVALALQLAAGGIQTTYPRAIYMTGETVELSEGISDNRRYVSHARLVMPDGRTVLREGHDYIILWGYWNAPDEVLAVRDEDIYRGINALAAYREGVLDDGVYLSLMQRTRDRMGALGIEDLNLRGNHILLSLDLAGKLVRDADGLPVARICNFELLRKTGPAGPAGSGREED
jgi:hypothetical protein